MNEIERNIIKKVLFEQSKDNAKLRNRITNYVETHKIELFDTITESELMKLCVELTQ